MVAAQAYGSCRGRGLKKISTIRFPPESIPQQILSRFGGYDGLALCYCART